MTSRQLADSSESDGAPVEPPRPAPEVEPSAEAAAADSAGKRTSGRWRAYLRSLLGDE